MHGIGNARLRLAGGSDVDDGFGAGRHVFREDGICRLGAVRRVVPYKPIPTLRRQFVLCRSSLTRVGEGADDHRRQGLIVVGRQNSGVGKAVAGQLPRSPCGVFRVAEGADLNARFGPGLGRKGKRQQECEYRQTSCMSVGE